MSNVLALDDIFDRLDLDQRVSKNHVRVGTSDHGGRQAEIGVQDWRAETHQVLLRGGIQESDDLIDRACRRVQVDLEDLSSSKERIERSKAERVHRQSCLQCPRNASTA
ncbi:MAG: hypothetical protein U0263_31200 [Polyangiaceae bacterium]